MDAAARGGVWHRAAPALGADDPRDVGSPERFRLLQRRRLFGFREKNERNYRSFASSTSSSSRRATTYASTPSDAGRVANRAIGGYTGSSRAAPHRARETSHLRASALRSSTAWYGEHARARAKPADERRRDYRGERFHDAGAVRRQGIGCSVVLAMAVMAALYIAGMNGVRASLPEFGGPDGFPRWFRSAYRKWFRVPRAAGKRRPRRSPKRGARCGRCRCCGCSSPWKWVARSPPCVRCFAASRDRWGWGHRGARGGARARARLERGGASGTGRLGRGDHRVGRAVSETRE